MPKLYGSEKAKIGTATGTIIVWARAIQNDTDLDSAVLPAGYLRCDGTRYNASNFPALAEVIGTGANCIYKKPTNALSDTQIQLPDLGSKHILGSGGGNIGVYYDVNVGTTNTRRVGVGVEITNEQGDNFGEIGYNGFLRLPSQPDIDFNGNPAWVTPSRTDETTVSIAGFQGHAHLANTTATRVRRDTSGSDVIASPSKNFYHSPSNYWTAPWNDQGSFGDYGGQITPSVETIRNDGNTRPGALGSGYWGHNGDRRSYSTRADIGNNAYAGVQWENDSSSRDRVCGNWAGGVGSWFIYDNNGGNSGNPVSCRIRCIGVRSENQFTDPTVGYIHTSVIGYNPNTTRVNFGPSTPNINDANLPALGGGVPYRGPLYKYGMPWLISTSRSVTTKINPAIYNRIISAPPNTSTNEAEHDHSILKTPVVDPVTGQSHDYEIDTDAVDVDVDDLRTRVNIAADNDTKFDSMQSPYMVVEYLIKI